MVCYIIMKYCTWAQVRQRICVLVCQSVAGFHPLTGTVCCAGFITKSHQTLTTCHHRKTCNGSIDLITPDIEAETRRAGTWSGFSAMHRRFSDAHCGTEGTCDEQSVYYHVMWLWDKISAKTVANDCQRWNLFFFSTGSNLAADPASVKTMSWPDCKCIVDNVLMVLLHSSCFVTA